MTTATGVTDFKFWVTPQHNKDWHIEHGDSPIYDALVAEMGNPYREPVSKDLIARRQQAAKKLKAPASEEKKAKKAADKALAELANSAEKKPPLKRTPSEELTIELAKLRKMTRPQLGSYIATNRQYLSDKNESYGGQTRKAVLHEAAVRIARAKIVGR